MSLSLGFTCYAISINYYSNSADEAKVLGKGQFGLVLQGTVDGDVVAVKTVQRNADKQYLKALLSELKIMIHLGKHQNVVPLVGAYTRDLKRGNEIIPISYFHIS
jgi:predicted Ser/Thr protein kinase